MASFLELINGEKPTLVDFFATWCGPCKMMHPVLEQLKELTEGSVNILKIDIDNPANNSIVSSYRIASVPTLIIFRNGQPVWRQSGAMSAPDLKEIIDNLPKE